MLVLTQKVGDSIYIFNGNAEKILRVGYVALRGNQIHLGFEANNDITILRDKILHNKSLQEITDYVLDNKHKNKRNRDEPIFFMEEGENYNEDL